MPLWQKMYTRPHYIDMVRMVGYSGLPVPEAQAKTQDLLARYRKQLLNQADFPAEHRFRPRGLIP